MFHGSAPHVDSKRAASGKQVNHAGQSANPATASTVSSPEDKKTLERKSRKERALALLRFGKNNRAAPQATGLHVEYALTGLNARIFEDSILDSLELNDNRSWSDRTRDMTKALAKLNMLGPEHIHKVPVGEQVVLGEIFRNISSEVQAQRAEINKKIDGTITSRVQELQSKIETIRAGEKTAASEAAVQEALHTYNKGFKELELAKKTWDDIGRQADRLAGMTSVPEVLRGLARRMRELDSMHETISATNEQERIGQVKHDKKEKAKKLLAIMGNRELESHEQQEALNALNKGYESLTARQGYFWMGKLAEQNAERGEVANQIADVFSKTAEKGIDLSKELSADEIIYLTRAMGGAEGRHRDRGLVVGEDKEAVLINEKGGGTKVVMVPEVTRQETDKLARQNADLLHEPQLQSFLDRLTAQETHLNEAIKHLSFHQPDSATVVRESTEKVLGALRRLDPQETSRLRNHSQAKKEMTTSRIAEGGNRVWTRAETLRNIILNTLDSPQANSLTDKDRRQLEQAAKLLEHVKSSVDAF